MTKKQLSSYFFTFTYFSLDIDITPITNADSTYNNNSSSTVGAPAAGRVGIGRPTLHGGPVVILLCYVKHIWHVKIGYVMS